MIKVKGELQNKRTKHLVLKPIFGPVFTLIQKTNIFQDIKKKNEIAKQVKRSHLQKNARKFLHNQKAQFNMCTALASIKVLLTKQSLARPEPSRGT